MKTTRSFAAALFALSCAAGLRAEPASLSALNAMSSGSPEGAAARFDGAAARPAAQAADESPALRRDSGKSWSLAPERSEDYRRREEGRQELREREHDDPRYAPRARGVEASAPDWALLAFMALTLIGLILFIAL